MKLLFLKNLNFPMVVTMKTFFEHATFCLLMKAIMNLFISFAQTTNKISSQTTACLYYTHGIWKHFLSEFQHK